MGLKCPNPECGIEVDAKDKFCRECGARLPQADKQSVRQGASFGDIGYVDGGISIVQQGGAGAGNEVEKCPLCHFNNLKHNTFKCTTCGQDWLCNRHWDSELRMCEGCSLPIHAAKAEAAWEFDKALRCREELGKLKPDQALTDSDRDRLATLGALASDVHEAKTAKEWAEGVSKLEQMRFFAPENSKVKELLVRFQETLEQEISQCLAQCRPFADKQYNFLALDAAEKAFEQYPDNRELGELLEELKGRCRTRDFTDPVIGMEFVWVPGGCFQMGSNDGGGDEKPVHEVCVDGFWMGKFEVTQGQWKKVMGNNPSHFDKGDDYPVENVSWNDAQGFIRELSSHGNGKFRLPTEAEWEYACRSGGRDEKYSGGDDVDRVAWHEDNSGGSTHRVGTKAANGLGLHDMSGNVWEWCEDVYDKNAYSRHSRNNPIYEGGGSLRVDRGGSWYYGPRFVRCAYRDRSDPDCRIRFLGFRLVRTN